MRRFTAYYARQSSELERVALGHLVGLLAAKRRAAPSVWHLSVSSKEQGRIEVKLLTSKSCI
jgi:hypothetical protein